MLGCETLTYTKVCFAPLTLRMPKISLRYTIFRFVFLGCFVLMLGCGMFTYTKVCFPPPCMPLGDRTATSYFE